MWDYFAKCRANYRKISKKKNFLHFHNHRLFSPFISRLSSNFVQNRTLESRPRVVAIRFKTLSRLNNYWYFRNNYRRRSCDNFFVFRFFESAMFWYIPAQLLISRLTPGFKYFRTVLAKLRPAGQFRPAIIYYPTRESVLRIFVFIGVPVIFLMTFKFE